MEEPTREIHPFSYSSAISNETKELNLSTLQGNPMYGVEGESVSFGRFTSESLSWEKWSTFNRNRYVEEAEKYSKPGSVKQKKAFLEAHFKRMTTLKDDSADQANTIQEAPIEPNMDDTTVRNYDNELHPHEMILSSPPPSINDQQWVEKEVEIVDFGVDQNEDKTLKTDLIDVEKAEKQNPVIETESGLINTQENSAPTLKRRNPPLSSYIPSVEAGTSLISSSTPAKSGIQSPAVHPVKEMDKKSWMDDQNKKRSPSLYKLINRKLGRLVSPVVKKIGISSKASKNSGLKTPPKAKSEDRLCRVFFCGSKLQSKSFQGGRGTESSNI